MLCAARVSAFLNLRRGKEGERETFVERKQEQNLYSARRCFVSRRPVTPLRLALFTLLLTYLFINLLTCSFTPARSPALPFSRVLPAFRQLQTSAPRATITVNSVTDALELIRSQPSHYVRATLAGKELILTPRDLVTVPRLKDVDVGDVLTLDAITELGSREYTLRGNPYVPTQLASVSATVVEHTMGKMEEIFKKKRRKGYQRTIKHKQTYTRLRIGDIQINPPETPLAP